MRKSGGSTLQATISKLLNVPEVQAPCLTDFDNLRHIAKESKIICFAHLHPTSEALEFIKNLDTPVVVLLRNPRDAFDALKRHKAINGDNFRPNGALYFRQSDQVMNEFYANWLSLRDRPNIQIVLYENLYGNFRDSVKHICHHFGHNINVDNIIQENRRYSNTPREFHSIDVFQLPISKATFCHYPVVTPFGRFRYIVSSIIYRYVHKLRIRGNR